MKDWEAVSDEGVRKAPPGRFHRHRDDYAMRWSGSAMRPMGEIVFVFVVSVVVVWVRTATMVGGRVISPPPFRHVSLIHLSLITTAKRLSVVHLSRMNLPGA